MPIVTWNPTPEQARIYSKWKDVTMSLLVSSRKGIRVSSLTDELKKTTGGKVIPLERMGLQVPNIKNYLYEMAMSSDLLMLREVEGYLFVFVNESQVPENLKDARKLVMDRKENKLEYPLRTHGKYIPPHKVRGFFDVTPHHEAVLPKTLPATQKLWKHSEELKIQTTLNAHQRWGVKAKPHGPVKSWASHALRKHLQ